MKIKAKELLLSQRLSMPLFWIIVFHYFLLVGLTMISIDLGAGRPISIQQLNSPRIISASQPPVPLRPFTTSLIVMLDEPCNKECMQKNLPISSLVVCRKGDVVQSIRKRTFTSNTHYDSRQQGTSKHLVTSAVTRHNTGILRLNWSEKLASL